MYCSQCGTEILGDVRYCPRCGARQRMGMIAARKAFSEKSSDKEKEQKGKNTHRWRRRIRDLLIMAAALLVLFVMDEKVPSASSYASWQTDASYIVMQNQKEMIICNGQGGVCILDIPQQVLYSADRSRMAYVDGDQELYYMDDITPVFIDDEINSAQISFYGDTLAYVRDADEDGTQLCIYTIEKEASKRMSVGSCSEFILSPDGRTLAYLETDQGGTLSVWHTEREAVRLSGNVSEIFFVSDNGEAVLYRKDGDHLCLFADGEDREVASVSGTICYMLNETQTEMIYTENGNTWYYCVDQREPVRLTGVKGTIEAAVPMEDIAYQQRQGLILGRKTLKNMIFATSDSKDSAYKVYRLDENGEEAAAVPN